MIKAAGGWGRSPAGVQEDPIGFVLLGTQDGVTPQLLLHLAAFVSEIINFQSSARISSCQQSPIKIIDSSYGPQAELFSLLEIKNSKHLILRN